MDDAGMTEEENNHLDQLKRFIRGDEELEALDLQDRFLLHFIRGRKYDVRKAYDTLKKYIHIRQVTFSDFFQNAQPGTSKGLEQRVYRVFRNRDKLNRTIGISRMEWWDPDEINFDDMLEAALFFFEEAWNDKDVECTGMVAILDCEGFSFKHFRHCSLQQLKKMHEIFWTAFPLRFKAVHVVNEPMYFKMVYALCYPFIPVKLRSRTYFHGSNKESLHKNIHPEVLPKSLGGWFAEEDANIWDTEFERRILQK